MKKIFFAALVLMALTACKNVKETAEIIDLPRTETPDSVARAMDGFFEQAATDSMDIHSVMIVRDGSVIYSRWQSEGVDTVPHVLHSVSKTFTATAVGLAIADGKLGLIYPVHSVEALMEAMERCISGAADLQQMDDPMEFIERTKNQYPGLNMDDVRLAFEEVKEEVQRLKEEKNMKGKKTKTTEQ